MSDTVSLLFTAAECHLTLVHKRAVKVYVILSAVLSSGVMSVTFMNVQVRWSKRCLEGAAEKSPTLYLGLESFFVGLLNFLWPYLKFNKCTHNKCVVSIK